MKTLILSLIILVLVGCNTPIRIVESYYTDSTGKMVKTITKYYDSTRYPSVNPSVNVSPFWNPWYDPFWRPYPFFAPRTIIVNPRPPIKRR